MNPEAYIEMAETEDRHWWFRGRRLIIAATLRQLHLPKACHILEVGCGTGGNFDMLRQFGSIAALDTDAIALEFSRHKSIAGEDIRRGTLPTENPFLKKSFELICLFDVLEHITDDRQSLAQLRNCLSDNGHLVLTVPAFSWLWSNHDVFLHHKRRYTRNGLVATLATLGFQVERATYFNFLLFPLTAAVRLVFRLLAVFGLTNDVGTALPHPAVNGILFRIFASEQYLLERFNFPVGLSLLIVARTKPAQL